MLPPSIPLKQGWNLVPVLSISGAEIGSSISADDYFTGLNWNVAHGPDPSIGIDLTNLSPNSGAYLIVGQGYYVFMQSAGTLVP